MPGAFCAASICLCQQEQRPRGVSKTSWYTFLFIIPESRACLEVGRRTEYHWWYPSFSTAHKQCMFWWRASQVTAVRSQLYFENEEAQCQRGFVVMVTGEGTQGLMQVRQALSSWAIFPVLASFDFLFWGRDPISCPGWPWTPSVVQAPSFLNPSRSWNYRPLPPNLTEMILFNWQVKNCITIYFDDYIS